MSEKLNAEYVNRLLLSLENGGGQKFFDAIEEDVVWVVKGTHDLAGEYRSKQEFLDNTFKKLNQRLISPLAMKLINCYISGNTAIAELKGTSESSNGVLYHNDYCWILKFTEALKISHVTAYLDSQLILEFMQNSSVT